MKFLHLFNYKAITPILIIIIDQNNLYTRYKTSKGTKVIQCWGWAIRKDQCGEAENKWTTEIKNTLT